MASACQWFGVTIETASMALSSSTRWRSHSVAGAAPVFSSTSLTAGPKSRSSTSQTVRICTLWLSFSAL